MKVFYSWQSDRPRRLNRDLIRSAIDKAVSRLNSESLVEDASRGLKAIEVDQDTQGVMGAPPIAQTIFTKIEAADVMVADVTAVSENETGKKFINSNVAIEIGYLLGKRGYQPLLKVMNSAYGGTDDLPFDLKDRRHPVIYTLSDEDTKHEISKTRDELANKLYPILREYLKNLTTSKVSAAQIPRIPETAPGQYWKNDEEIVPAESRYNSLALMQPGGRHFFIRLRPSILLDSLSSVETLDMIQPTRIVVRGGGQNSARNRWGAVAYSANHSSGKLFSWTQLHRNREIWFIDPYYSDCTSESVEGSFVPTGAIKDEFPKAMKRLLRFSHELGYGKTCIVEMGLVGAEGLRLAINPRYWDAYPGPLYQDVRVEREIASEADITRLYNDFIDEMFNEAGSSAPDECKVLE